MSRCFLASCKMILRLPQSPPGNRTGGLKLHKRTTTRLQIFKDKQQALQDVDVENLAKRYFPPLHENFSQLDLTGWRTDLVPCCASTAMFSVSPLPTAPISGHTNPVSSAKTEPKLKIQKERLQPVSQEFKVDDNGMANDSVTQSPDQPNFRLAAVFNQFVHSPDESGRLRGDVTKFTDAFLTNRSENPTSAGDRRGPPMFQDRFTMALINANFSLLLWGSWDFPRLLNISQKFDQRQHIFGQFLHTLRSAMLSISLLSWDGHPINCLDIFGTCRRGDGCQALRLRAAISEDISHLPRLGAEPGIADRMFSPHW
ncbi:hypothetical protein Aperf_G00000125534 [Anoplocephala perfoliata]